MLYIFFTRQMTTDMTENINDIDTNKTVRR